MTSTRRPARTGTAPPEPRSPDPAPHDPAPHDPAPHDLAPHDAEPPPAGPAPAGDRLLVRLALAVSGTGLGALAFGLWLGDVWPSRKVAILVDGEPLAVWGLPVIRLVADLAAIVTIGTLVTALLLPHTAGALGEVARRALRGARWAALAWGVSGLVMLLFTFADTTGLPFARLPLTSFTGYDPDFPEAVPYLFGVVLALVLAASVSITERRRGVLIVLGMALYNVLPITTQGHAQHSALTAYALTFHFAAITLWVGGLAGLVLYARAAPEALAVAVPRFSTLALGCFVVASGSGIVMSYLNLLDPTELWRSRYGLIIAGKLTLLAVLGVFGWWHRKRTVPAVAERRSRRAFVQLAVVEVIVMAGAAALGVALSDTATPATSGH